MEVHDTPLARKMREYDKINALVISMKGWKSAYLKDFDKTPDIGLKKVSQLKRAVAKELTVLIKDELPKIHIKGIAIINLAGILAYAHPSRFPSQRKFLHYCGYTQASRINKRYCHKIKSIMFMIVGCIIKAKDPKYYPMYLKFKEDARARSQPGKSKMGIHRIAMNRTATFILKEIYQIWRVKPSLV
jgi:hypothetical protein